VPPLTGPELAVDAVTFGEGVIARSYVPTAAVLPEAALVVTHGGMGTLMAAFAAAVPAVCLPLGRDQESNARRAQELGATVVLGPDTPPEELALEIRSAIDSAELRAAADRMASSVRSYQGGDAAVAALERISVSAPP
jgi:UDP:flavonoid glycosyltransferase YjiC (YdhE family)